MEHFKIAVALNKELKLPEDHFGESVKFLIYTLKQSEFHFYKSIPNEHKNEDIEEDHGNPEKGKGIASLLQKEEVDAVISKSFGKNISIISKYFLPIIVKKNDIPNVIKIIEYNTEELIEASKKHKAKPISKAFKID